MNYFYIIPIPEESMFKIGITTNIEQRLKEHQTNWRTEFGKFDKSAVQFIKSSSAGKIRLIEQHLKYVFEKHNKGLDVAGHTEIYHYACIDQVIDELKRQVKLYGLVALEDYTDFNSELNKKPNPHTKEAKAARKELRKQRVMLEN